MNITLSEYIDLTQQQKLSLSNMLIDKHKNLSFKGISDNKYKLLCFKHKKTGLEFIFIPGGRFKMGLSEEEEKAANNICNPPPLNIEEMRPYKETVIPSFFISVTPLLNIHIEKYNNLFPSIPIDYDKENEMYYPFFCEYSLAAHLANNLNMSLPDEKEWEYACRANTKTLFCFGDTLPAEKELKYWLNWDLAPDKETYKNDFELYGLFFGEWCKDNFKVTLSENADSIEGAKTIRGSGAYFWPWQDEEWVGCMSAFRMPSSDLIDNTAAFRLVIK